MASSSKFHFNLFIFCVASLSIIGASLAGESETTAEMMSIFLQNSPIASPDTTCAVPQSKCASECDRRCSNTSHRNNCLLFCNKCCNVCLCVPPGTYGNKECCPCYNDWKTKEGGPKCP